MADFDLSQISGYKKSEVADFDLSNITEFVKIEQPKQEAFVPPEVAPEVQEVEESIPTVEKGLIDTATERYKQGVVLQSRNIAENNYRRTGNEGYLVESDTLSENIVQLDELDSVMEKAVGYTTENLPQMNPALYGPRYIGKLEDAIKDRATMYSGEEISMSKVAGQIAPIVLGYKYTVAKAGIEAMYFDAAAGGAFRELRLMEDAEGNKMPLTIASAAAAGVGIFTTITEMVGDLLIGKVFKAAGIPVEKIITGAAKKLFISKAYQKVGQAALTSVAGNVIEEVTQQSFEVTMQELAKEFSNASVGTDIKPATFNQMWSEVVSVIEPAFYAAAGMTTTATVGGTSYRMTQEKLADNKVKREANNLTAQLAKLEAMQEETKNNERVVFEKAIDEPGIFGDSKQNLDTRKNNALEGIVSVDDTKIEGAINDLLYTKQGDRSAFSRKEQKEAKAKVSGLRKAKKDLNTKKREVINKKKLVDSKSGEGQKLEAERARLLAEVKQLDRDISQTNDLLEQMIKPEFPKSDKALIYGSDNIKAAKDKVSEGFIEDTAITEESHTAFKKELAAAAREVRKAILASDKEGERRGKAKMKDTLQRMMDKQGEVTRKNKISKDIKNLISKASKKSGEYTAEVQSFFKSLKDVQKMTSEKATWKLHNMQAVKIKEGEIDYTTVGDQLLIDALRLKADAKSMDFAQLEEVLTNLKLTLAEGASLREIETSFPSIIRARTTERISSEIVGPKGTFEQQKKIYNSMTDAERSNIKSSERAARWIKNQLQLIGSFMVADLHTIGEMITGRSGIPYAKTKMRELLSTIVPERTQRALSASWAESLQLSTASAFGIPVIDKDGNKISRDKLSLQVRRRQNREANILVEIQTANGKQTLRLPEARKRWMEWQDTSRNGGRDRLAKQGYTEDGMESLYEGMSDGSKKLIDAQFKLYASIYEQVNAVFSRIKGYNLPEIAKYSPLISKKMMESIDKKSSNMDDSIFMSDLSTMNPKTAQNQSALQERAGTGELVAVSDVEVMMSYVSDMAHYIAWADKIKDLNTSLRSPDFTVALDMRFGEKNRRHITTVLHNQVDDLARGSTDFRQNSKTLDFIRTNFTVASLSGKLLMTPKQLISFPAYSEGVNKKDFAAGVVDFLRDPKKAVNTVRALSSDINLRGFDYDRDSKDATEINFGDTAAAKWMFEARELKKMAMYPIKLGDKGAAYLGAYARMRALAKQAVKENRVVTEKELVLDAEDFTAGTQQSSEGARQSGMQRGNSGYKLLTSFISSPLAMQRKILSATRQRFNGRITTAEWAEVVAIHQIIIPSMFTFVANGFHFDKEDQLLAAMVGPWSALPILGSIIENIFRDAAGEEIYKGSPIAVWDSVQAVQKVLSDGVRPKDVAKSLKLATPVPSVQLLNMVDGGKNITEGDVMMGLMQTLGMSEYSANKNYGDGR